MICENKTNTTKRSPSLQNFMIATSTTNRRSDAFQEFKYNAKLKRFRVVNGAGKGSFISKAAFQNRLAQYIEQQQRSLVDLADKISGGSIDLSTFQRKAAGFLKEIHTSIGLSFVEQLKPEDNETIQQILIEQFHAGRDGDRSFGVMHLARELKSGSVSPPQLKARLQLYAASGKRTYHAIDRNIKRRDGMRWGKRVLGSAHKHCADCLRMAGEGWKAIEDITLPTMGCSCLNRCVCRIEWRTELPKSEQRKRELEAIDRLVKGRKRG